MFVTVILLLIPCGIVQSSDIHPVAPVGAAPIVTAASSQYFERTFNRLVAVPPLLEPALPFAPAPVPPVIPVAPPNPFFSVLPIAPAPPVVVDAPRTTIVPVNPTNPPLRAPENPNIAIAIATAQAAPVATILLPPYPFGLPPAFGVLPQQPPSDTDTREATTLKTTTTVQATTTQREEDATTPLPSNIDNSFAQAPSNQNFNFKQYLTPQLPQQGIGPQQLPAPRPQEFDGPNPRPQQFPGSDIKPQVFSGPNLGPQRYPGPKPGTQEFPAPNLRPTQFPGTNSGPTQFPGPNSRPQQFPNPNQRPQQFPEPSTRPDKFPGTNLRPQDFAVPTPWPQQIPQHLPLPDARPIKFKTNVEVVPVPLAYIAPPSPHEHHHHNHQHHHHHRQALRVVPHIHTFVPKTLKIIIRPVTRSLRTRSLRVPAGFTRYGPPKLVRRVALKAQNIRSRSRDTELTTFRPINRYYTKPPIL